MDTIGMGQLRKNNTRNRILQIIRTQGRASKIEIKNISRYSMATVLDAVDALLADGLVYYAEKGNTKSGRRPTYISLKPEGGYFLGISFHAREATAVLLDYCGEVLDHKVEAFHPEDVTVEYMVGRLQAMLRDMLAAHRALRPRLLGVGVGTPGYVDDKNGVCVYYSHIENFRNVPLQALLEQAADGLPVYLENNSNAMSLAYKWLHPENVEGSSVIISIRSGVRMSSLINGILHKGMSLTAGEIGHIRVEGSSRYCPCGKQGCLDTEASDNAVLEKILAGVKVNRFAPLWEMAGRDSANVDMDLFIRSVQAGHADSVALLEEVCARLGECLAQIINMLNPGKIIFNARLCALGPLFFDRIRHSLQDRAIYLALEGLTLEPVAFGDKSAAIGAAAIVMERQLACVDAAI